MIRERRLLINNQGFTLVEVLIVLALIGLVIGVASSLQLFGIRSFNVGTSRAEMQRTARIIEEVIRSHSEIRHADIVASGSAMQLHLDGKRLYYGNVSAGRYLDLSGAVDGEITVEMSAPSYDMVEYKITVDTYELKGRLFLGNIRGQEDNNLVSSPMTLNNSILYYSVRRITGASGFEFSDVFLFGEALQFAGDQIEGDGVIFLDGDLDTPDANLGAGIAASRIWINGNASLNHGSASLGSALYPEGEILVNGDLELWTGSRHVHGDVFVNGNFRLKDAQIHGNVYVDGDVELGWTPQFHGDAKVFYTGSLTHPAWYSQSVLDRVVHVDTVQPVQIPNIEMPTVRDANWYQQRGYSIDAYEPLQNNVRVFADSFTSSGWTESADDVVIVAETGDINIGNTTLTGVLFAPNGSVTFNGGSFEGVVITRDGVFVTSGGSTVKLKELMDFDFINGPHDYPFSL